MLLIAPPRQFHPRHDIAPLVRPADLQHDAEPAVQFAEIVALQDHVVEFEEGHRLLALQPKLHGVECQHAVDGEMGADIPQQVDVAQLVQPVGVVDHDRVGRTVAEAQERAEAALDPLHIRRDLRVGQHLPRLVFARGIADPRRPPAHQHDRLVAVFLQQTQDHDLHQTADVQAVGGAIEADIGGRRSGVHDSTQRIQIGALMDEASVGGFPQEVGGGHGGKPVIVRKVGGLPHGGEIGKCHARSV